MPYFERPGFTRFAGVIAKIPPYGGSSIDEYTEHFMETKCPVFMDLPIYEALWMLYNFQKSADFAFDEASLKTQSFYNSARWLARQLAIKLVLWLIREHDVRLYALKDNGIHVDTSKEITADWLAEVKKLHKDVQQLADDIDATMAAIINRELG